MFKRDIRIIIHVLKETRPSPKDPNYRPKQAQWTRTLDKFLTVLSENEMNFNPEEFITDIMVQ